MADAGQQIDYSCKCLNVRIRPSPPPTPSEEATDSNFHPAYVDDDGISVVHTQLTLRSKGPHLETKRGESGSPTRYITLSCFVCQCLVYRVLQVVSPDGERGEGPVLPNEDWAENEVLKSASGWIELSQQCLSGTAISDAEASPLYSKTFRVVLPSGVSSAPSATPLYTPPSPSIPQGISPDTPRTLLPPLPALFPPPPFTPTHPVFVHLSAAATVESEGIRAEAEEELRKVVAAKVAEIEAAEAKLKRDTELIWNTFKGTMDKYEEELNPLRRIQLPKRRNTSKSRQGAAVNGISSSVRIVDFVPTLVAPSRVHSPPAAVAAPSALSASLATSSLHQAMGQVQSQTEPVHRSVQSISPARSAGVSSGTAARSMSPSTASSRTLGIPIDGEAEIRAFRRNMDASLDVATSFKYMTDLGAQMQASGLQTQPEVPEEEEAVQDAPLSPSASTVAPRGRSPRTGKSAFKKARSQTPQIVQESSSKASGSEDPQKDEATPRGKRKVTFDVKPEVAIISNETPVGTALVSLDEEVPVFDMDSELVGDDTEVDVSVSAALPLNQPPAPVQDVARAPRRPARSRPASISGLPSSLSTLRPASLPMPSAMPTRRVITSERVDERSRANSVRESMLSVFSEDGKRLITDNIREEPEDEVNEREAEILKLVAASMPSHRSAWKRNSSAWQTFIERQRAKQEEKAAHNASEDEDTSNGEGAAYYDESEDESEEEQRINWSRTAMAQSLPIPIGPLRTKGGLPKGIVSNRATSPPAIDRAAAAALRRASYAERDRHREIDPGALDFAAEDDDDGEGEDDAPQAAEQEVVAKSRRIALKIIQKRDSLPPDGLWRSLA